MKTKFYYYDEQNDDFANLNIKTKKIDDSYKLDSLIHLWKLILH